MGAVPQPVGAPMNGCYVRQVWPDGTRRPVSYSADSLEDAASHESPDGVYTVTNTYHRFLVIRLNAHLDRLEDSAARRGLSVPVDRPTLRTALRAMIADSGFDSVRFRITVPPEATHLVVSMEPFMPIAESLVQAGVRVMTAPGAARAEAATKHTAWMHERRAIKASMPPGTYDAILLDDAGHLLEGLGANFYAIRDGTLYTPESGVLPGIAQQIVLTVAPDILPVQRTALTVADLPQIREAFISSSSRGIVPVVQIDAHTLGDGRPGRFTLALLAAYRRWVIEHLDAI